MSWGLVLQIFLLIILVVLILMATISSLITDLYRERTKLEAARYWNFREHKP